MYASVIQIACESIVPELAAMAMLGICLGSIALMRYRLG